MRLLKGAVLIFFELGALLEAALVVADILLNGGALDDIAGVLASASLRLVAAAVATVGGLRLCHVRHLLREEAHLLQQAVLLSPRCCSSLPSWRSIACPCSRYVP